MKSLTPNTLIQNRYLIVQLIGKGGMGEVYLAVDQRLGSAVALKRTMFTDDEMLGVAFEREAKTLARLRHPVLPKVSDHFSENGEQYLVMEHIAGDDLSKRLEAAQRPFPVSWVLFWADQLLDALSYLHSHEPPILHRDIKPQNLKLTDENHIVLLDFGLSKNSTGQTLLTSAAKSSGSVVGYTPHYAPMEQIRGTGTSPKSDLYALSATLYQLMTNEVPADALTRADALLNEMPDPIRPMTEINPEVPKVVSDVILKGMEISQDKRFAKAVDMQKALRRAFTNMQDAMGAQTVAFSVDESQAAINGSAAVDDGLADFNSVTDDSEMPTRVTSQVTSGTSVPAGQVAEEGSPLPQSAVKTEVFLGGAGLFDPEVDKQEISDSPADVDSADLSDAVSDFAPDATIPVINFENGGTAEEAVPPPPTPDFHTAANIQADGDSFATYTPSTDRAKVAIERPSAPPMAVAAAAKGRSSSKTAIVVGGLFAAFILVIIAAGAGWFVYSNYYAASAPEPSASPEPSIAYPATPEPTVEVLAETAPSPSDVTSSGLENSNTELPSEQVSGSTPSTDSSRPSQPQAAPRRSPGRQATASETKPAEKPKKAGERTVILQ